MSTLGAHCGGCDGYDGTEPDRECKGLDAPEPEPAVLTRVDWSSLSDEQAWALLVDRPKMAGRWSRTSSRLYRRRDPDGNLVAEVRWDQTVGHRVKVSGPLTAMVAIGEVHDVDAAIRMADEHLRRKGWRLLDGGDDVDPK